MTLKVRLAAMMMLLIVAVLCLQYLLTLREQRELADRISRVADAINATSARATFTALMSGVEHDDRRLDELAGRDGSFAATGTRAMVRLIQSEGERRRYFEETFEEHPDSVTKLIRRYGAGAGAEPSMIVLHGAEAESVIRRHAQVPCPEPPESLAVSGRLRTLVDIEVESGIRREATVFIEGHETPGFDATLDSLLAWKSSDSAWVTGDAAFVFRLPLMVPESDSLQVMEISYPLGELTDALAQSRRRGLWWMGSLLGVGLLGAALMAVQFTKPIRSLEQSFRRVEDGDFDVALPVSRPDEIGRLTRSFNRMVERLRSSRAVEQRLTEAERLAAMGRLAAGVAHEVRNPLNAIQLNLQQLHDKAAPGDDAPQRADFDRYYRTVTGEISRLERLVGAFLHLSKSEAVIREPLDLSASLDASVALFQPEAAECKVAIEAEIPPALRVTGDASRLSTVWNNLLANALGASSPGGHVWVNAVLEGDDIVVSVRDDGCGMNAEQQARIFDPFFSGREDGTGLGLSIVRAVVEHHDGRVDVTSEPGVGTVMRVVLPHLEA